MAKYLVIASYTAEGMKGFAEKGFRQVINTHADAGQTVFHVHLHLMGGRHFGWPPG